MRSRMRLLYRLARSVYAGKFIPKGAMLFAVWMESGHRPARDLDLLGFGEASNEGLPETFQRLCDRTIEPDGLTFDSGSIRVAEIRESQNDPGQWVNLCGLLGIPSGPRSGTLGMRSSRMRDFYEQWVIARQFSFWKEGRMGNRAFMGYYRATCIVQSPAMSNPEHIMLPAVQALSFMSNMRDPYLGRHENRVGHLAAAIGRDMGLDEERCRGLRICGIVHDLGKIAVPFEILAKPGKLTPYEFEIVKTHSALGEEILRNLDVPWPIATVSLQHHERIDGSGYPLGIKGRSIILESRIIAVADIVDAMASHRPYREGLVIDVVLAEITAQAGTQLDEAAVDTCVRLFTEKQYTFPRGDSW